MNKLPAKQIYLLSIIIIGIIALSVYSTYALFTFESSTSDIVNIHIPKSLQISENTYEYQQLVVEPNTVVTTDIDIYNRYDYDVCYSIWYKLVGNDIDESKVQIFENSNEVLTTSGVLTKTNNIRVTITIINDNSSQVKVNIGTIGNKKTAENCSLNLESDKKVINTSYNNPISLNEKLLEEIDKTKEEDGNYLTYKDETKIISYKSTDKIYLSETFSYNDELFTLENSEYLTIQELIDKKYLENKNIYFCQDNNQCNIIYKITKLEKEENSENEDEIFYNITTYDKLVGYSKGTSGIRKVNDQDYIFYGDNPDNFIYYNCQNNDDTSTCELWRIVGLFYNKEKDKYNVKIIRNDSIGKYQFDNNSQILLWTNSSLNKYLNEEYKFAENYDKYIDNIKQNIETLSSLDATIKKQDQIIESKINILSLSDYLNASSCQNSKINEYTDACFKNNWLNNLEIDREWTITTKEETLDSETKEDSTIENSILNSFAYSIGNQIIENNINNYLDVRPVVYLKSRIITIDGNGNIDSPYLIR